MIQRLNFHLFRKAKVVKKETAEKGEAKIARVIAPLVDVSRIVIYPKWSIEDMHGIDMTVYFTEESEKVPVDIQGKDNWNDYLAWISGTKAWLKRQHSQMSAQESYVKRRLVPINSGQSRKGILYQFNQGNEEIQERARFERSRTQLIPVFST